MNGTIIFCRLNFFQRVKQSIPTLLSVGKYKLQLFCFTNKISRYKVTLQRQRTSLACTSTKLIADTSFLKEKQGKYFDKQDKLNS